MIMNVAHCSVCEISSTLKSAMKYLAVLAVELSYVPIFDCSNSCSSFSFDCAFAW